MEEDFAAVVERWMSKRGMNKTGTARAARYANHTMLSLVLSGDKDPNPSMASRLDHVLNAGGEIVEAERRHAARAAAERLPVRELSEEADELGTWAETGTVGSGTIEALADEIDRICCEYPTAAPGPLILRARAVRRRAGALLREHQTLTASRGLHVVAAGACSFLSVALGDLGHRQEAAAHAHTARILAGETGDPGAVAVAYSALSKVAFWDGRRQKAAEHAAAGFEAAARDAPVRVLLACQLADASPVPRARDALRLAAEARDESGPADPGLFTCSGVRLAAYSSTLALREGDPQAVLTAVQAGDDSGEGRSPHGSWVQLQISAALALLASGDADGATARLRPVLWMPAELKLKTFDSKLSAAAASARSPGFRGSGTARELAESIAGYLGGVPPAMPYPLALGAAG